MLLVPLIATLSACTVGEPRWSVPTDPTVDRPGPTETGRETGTVDTSAAETGGETGRDTGNPDSGFPDSGAETGAADTASTSCAVWDGDLEVASEADAEAFCAAACTITGDLTVLDGPVSLDALACLEGVGGTMDLDSDTLVSATLPDLAAIGGDLRTKRPAALEILSLPALATVGGDVDILFTQRLHTLSLPAAACIGGTVAVEDGEALVALDLSSLADVGDLQLLRDDALPSVSLPSLLAARGTLVVSLEAATSLSLPRLATATGLTVSGPSLAVSAPDLTEIGVLTVSGVPSLDLPALARAGNVSLYLDRLLPSLDLPALEEVGDLVLFASEARTVALPNLLDCTGSIQVRDMASLGTLSLPAISRVEDLDLSINAVLANLDFGALEAVEGDLQVEFLAAPHLDGLAGLRSVGGSLAIVANPALEDVAALEGIDTVGGNLDVLDNPLLPTASAEALVTAIGPEDIGGTVTILGNGP